MLFKKSISVVPTRASMVDIAVRWLEGLGSPASASRDIEEHDVMVRKIMSKKNLDCYYFIIIFIYLFI